MQEVQYIKINDYGSKFYYKDKAMTILHRNDGPAVEYSYGDKLWYVDGKLHRLDGPAIEYSYGGKAWAVNGKFISDEEYNRRTAKETVLTMDQIAAKFGIDVTTLKIAK